MNIARFVIGQKVKVPLFDILLDAEIVRVHGRYVTVTGSELPRKKMVYPMDHVNRDPYVTVEEVMKVRYA